MDAQQHYHSPQRTIPVPFPPVTHALLDEIVQRIRSVGNPQRVILFGSHARGDASSTSDIDILIIEDSTMPRYRRASHYLRALAGLYPAKDIVVWTPSEVDEWATVPQAFITTILREGRLLYEHVC
jgi:predicted nucleotidyltransferase